MSRENKIKIGLIVCLAIATCLCFGVVVRVSQLPKWKKTSITVEYGDPIDIKQEILTKNSDDLTLDLSSIANEKGKKYPAVGTYRIPATLNTSFGTQSKTIKIIVKDSEAPVFDKAPERIEVSAGDSTFNFEEEFHAKDLSRVTLRADTSEVDFDTAGTYEATITATDVYQNKTVKTFHVVITEAVSIQQPVVVQQPVQQIPAPQYISNPQTTYGGNGTTTYDPNGTLSNTYNNSLTPSDPNTTINGQGSQSGNQPSYNTYTDQSGNTTYYSN